MSRKVKAIAGIALVAIPAGALITIVAGVAYRAWLAPAPAVAEVEPTKDYDGDGRITGADIREEVKGADLREAQKRERAERARWKEAELLTNICLGHLHRSLTSITEQRDPQAWKEHLAAERREQLRLNAEHPLPPIPHAPSIMDKRGAEVEYAHASAARNAAFAERYEAVAARCMAKLKARPNGDERVWSVTVEHRRELERTQRLSGGM